MSPSKVERSQGFKSHPAHGPQPRPGWGFPFGASINSDCCLQLPVDVRGAARLIALMRTIPILFATLIAACSQSALPPEPENLCAQPGARCVNAPVRDVLAVDGDTFELQRLTDRGTERIRLRLIGWDSPETGNSAGCAAEEALGQKVEARAKELFASAQTLTFKPEGADRFGRTRAHVYLDGTHIGWLLAKDGLSKPWLSETVKPVWCE